MPEKNKRTELIAKALQDPAFKAALLKDPKAAIEKATGVKAPAGVTIQVLEDTASVVHLVLPAGAPKGALSDKELESVSGGSMKDTNYMACNGCTQGDSPPYKNICGMF